MKSVVALLILLNILGCQHTEIKLNEFELSVRDHISEQCRDHLDLLGCEQNICNYEYSFILESDAKKCTEESAVGFEKESGRKLTFNGKESSRGAVAGVAIAALAAVALSLGF